jgi:hypothetical protein
MLTILKGVFSGEDVAFARQSYDYIKGEGGLNVEGEGWWLMRLVQRFVEFQ